MIKIYVNDTDTRALINTLRERTADISPVVDALGQILVAGAQQRFVNQKDPDGVPWKPLSPVTLSRRRKGGGGAEILRDTGRLMSGIQYDVTGGALSVFSPEVYARTHQLGARKGQYGRNKRGNPIPWGDVPQRRFLGMSAEDQAEMNELLTRYIDASKPDSWWRQLLGRVRRLF